MFIDIAFNITSDQFKKNYEEIIERAKLNNVMPIFVGLDISTSFECFNLAKRFNTCCFVGIHPLAKEKISEFDPSLNFNLSDENIAGIGECGLDFYRANDREYQIGLLKSHLTVEVLPYFYHCRNAGIEFLDFLKNNQNKFKYNGVVHSFDGTFEEASDYINRGLFIGINGCSLRTEENIEVVKRIPIDRILIETDSPYCLIKNSYAASKYTSIVKNKFNEPSLVIQIAEVISKLKNISLDKLETILFENTLRAFPKIIPFTKFWNIEK